ncbi:hypothetical protein BGZ95_006018 [Linnemannia exigua]|uniref:Uncharacterized protein n=1 Tax=Linnemannia exigua TaxID=604196 RepID=A0AAD4DLK9_9FUNG|nr:hypothetical protein BGZ95_006018 [Linnemannia exigua]
MAAALIPGMRIWVAFVTFINLSVAIALYSYHADQIDHSRKQGNLDEAYDTDLGWRDYCSIITSVILFGIYAYSVWTRNRVTSLIQNKFLRAILILIPTGLLLYIHCGAIDSLVRAQNYINASRMNRYPDSYESYKFNSFVCPKEVPFCFLLLSNYFLSVITGVFVLVEVAMSFFMSSPRPSPKSVGV